MSETGYFQNKLADSEVIKLVQTNQQLFGVDSELVDDIWC